MAEKVVYIIVPAFPHLVRIIADEVDDKGTTTSSPLKIKASGKQVGYFPHWTAWWIQEEASDADKQAPFTPSSRSANA